MKKVFIIFLGIGLIGLIGKRINPSEKTKKLIVIESDGGHLIYNVTKEDPRVSKVWKNDVFQTIIINNSPKSVYLEMIEYGNRFSYSSNYPDVIPIDSGSTYSADHSISYVFTEPPSSIQTRSSGKQFRWHLRY